MSSFIEYLKDTKNEIAHVSWPTQKQAVTYTVLVIVVSVIVAVLLSVFDAIFTRALNWLIS